MARLPGNHSVQAKFGSAPILRRPSASARPELAGVRHDGARRDEPVGYSPLGFFLFILLTAVLFIRPADVFPGLEELPIYEAAIVICLMASLSAVARQFKWRILKSHPVNLCVVGLLPAIVLSHLSHGVIWRAQFEGKDFLKVLVYYVLLVSLLTTRRRLQIFLVSILVFVTTIALLSVLTYRGIIQLGALNPVGQHMGNNADGSFIDIPRLQGPGIFDDPNDFALVLVTSILIGAQLYVERKSALRRMACLAAIALLGIAFYLTRSRGGFLSLMSAIAVFLLCRYPPRRAALIGFMFLPVVLIVFAGGRQTNIDIGNNGDTAQGRMHLWRDSLLEMHGAPIFGVGSGLLAEMNGLVAHNSYVQGFAELGLFGGTLFIGAILIPALDLARLVRASKEKGLSIRDGWTGCVLAILAGYSVGIFSLTRNYVVSTYVVLGLAAAYASVAAYEHPEVTLLRGRALLRRLVIVSMATLVCLELIARFMVT
jgi:hypothetical protein